MSHWLGATHAQEHPNLYIGACSGLQVAAPAFVGERLKAIGKKGRIAYNSGIAGNSGESPIIFPTPPFREELGLGNGPVCE